MNIHTQTAEIYRSRVRIEALETAISDNYTELKLRIEALEATLATVTRALELSLPEERKKRDQ